MAFTKFKALAEKHDLSVDYTTEGGIADLVLWSPTGKIFKSSSCHCDCSLNSLVTDSGAAMDWPKSMIALREIIADGFDDCPDMPDCEDCNV